MRFTRTLLAIGAGVVLIAVGGNIHPRLVAQAAQSASAAASALDPCSPRHFSGGALARRAVGARLPSAA